MEFKDWYEKEIPKAHYDSVTAEEAWDAAITSTKVWQPMADAPRDDTPVLLKFKDDLANYNLGGTWEGLAFAGKRNSSVGWSFATLNGYGYFPTGCFEGWREI